MDDKDQRAGEQRPTATGEKTYSTGSRRVERLDAITLRGRVYETKEGESITLESQGSLLTVQTKDIFEARDISKDEKEILVVSNAKIVFETLLNPQEVEGILSRELVVEIGSAVNRCVECSRCSGGECECSRCVDITSLPGFERGGGLFRRRLS